MAFSIDSEALYADDDLLAMGISYDAQRHAVASGELAPVRPGVRTYTGAAVRAFLGLPAVSSASAPRQHGGRFDPPEHRAGDGVSRPRMRGPVEQQFFAKVDAFEARGLSRMQAVAAVVRSDPAGHRAMINEANQNRGR